MREYRELMPELSIKYKKSGFHKVQVKQSADVFEVLKKMYDSDTIEYNESVIVIFFDGANKTIGWTKHSSGGQCQTIVEIRTILAEALICGAVSIALSHNHPSGQLISSPEDDKITYKLYEACKIMNIRFLDHIIVAGDMSGYYSYSDEGKL